MTVPLDPRVTVSDVYDALRILIRNERRSLQAYHPALLERRDLWHPATLDHLVQRINDRSWRPQPAHAATRLKSRFATRPLILPDGPEELIVYAHVARRLRDAVSPQRRAQYGTVLFGNIPTAAGTPELLEPYLPNMLALNRLLEGAARRSPVILSLDISGFYEHVQHQVLLDTVRREALLDATDTWLLEQCLHSFAARFHTGTLLPQGLPQSYPTLSAILAEAYLIPLDARLHRLGVRYTRYVDDFRVLTSSRSRAEIRAFQIEAALRALGLSFSSDKTSVYDRHVDDGSGLPLMGGAAAAQLPEAVTRWAGIFPHHPHYAAWQRDLVALWHGRGAPREGRPFHRTAARFCLSRLEADPALIPDVVELLRTHPHEYEPVTWFLRRVPREHLPWEALRAALPEHHHGSAAAAVLRALAPNRHSFAWPERPPAVQNWLRTLKKHPLDTVRRSAAAAEEAWRRPAHRRPDRDVPPATLDEIGRALALHLDLPQVPRVSLNLPHIPAAGARARRTTAIGRLSLPTQQRALARMIALGQYHAVSGFFRSTLPIDGQDLHDGHVLAMVAHLNLLREQRRVVYAWALSRMMAWLAPGLPATRRDAIDRLLVSFTERRTSRAFGTRQEYQMAVDRLIDAVSWEVRAAWLETADASEIDGVRVESG